MSHTTGKLHITESGDSHWMREGRDEDNRGIFWCGSNPDGKAHANARRLVACWNACAGIPTEQLKRGGLEMPLLSTLADIRSALEVGDGPMLSELAGEIRKLKRERDELASMDRTQCPNCTNCIRDLREDNERLLSERDAAVRERDAACEALRFYADGENYKYPESGDLAVLQDDGSKARAALAKIGGRR